MAELGALGAIGYAIGSAVDAKKTGRRNQMVSNFLETASTRSSNDPNYSYKNYILTASQLGILGDPKVKEYGAIIKELDTKKQAQTQRATTADTLNQLAETQDLGPKTFVSDQDPLMMGQSAPSGQPQGFTEQDIYSKNIKTPEQIQQETGYLPGQLSAISKLVGTGAGETQTGKDNPLIADVLKTLGENAKMSHDKDIKYAEERTALTKALLEATKGPYKATVNANKDVTANDLMTGDTPVNISKNLLPVQSWGFNKSGGSGNPDKTLLDLMSKITANLNVIQDWEKDLFKDPAIVPESIVAARNEVATALRVRNDELKRKMPNVWREMVAAVGEQVQPAPVAPVGSGY